MIGLILSRLHGAALVMAGRRVLLNDDPFVTVQGVFDVLERNAQARRETQAVHHVREARKVVTREALKPLP
ncbi:hypothetical protein ACFPIF_10330 [Brevundimonas faecalis]|uniref:hypothetical protein n=1 Tax=Brevundimonas faecalis TaxID=947378 RepID=UPI00361E0F97